MVSISSLESNEILGLKAALSRITQRVTLITPTKYCQWSGADTAFVAQRGLCVLRILIGMAWTVLQKMFTASHEDKRCMSVYTPSYYVVEAVVDPDPDD
jgi:hypothetical protein